MDTPWEHELERALVSQLASVRLSSDGDESLIGRLSNVEVRQTGQGLKLGKYPLHFHLVGEVKQSYFAEAPMELCAFLQPVLQPYLTSGRGDGEAAVARGQLPGAREHAESAGALARSDLSS